MSVIPAKKRAWAKKQAEEDQKKKPEQKKLKVSDLLGDNAAEKPQEAAEETKTNAKGKNTKGKKNAKEG
ncbi:hypothetical protein PPK13_gp66 [Bacillus phage Ray17]|uniref:Uncharacterized protein n=1 Tax=Bacillus phage Ray17 TaxID=2315627 RepID=A0A386K6W4_9CAUD|nr:hypothetical protein PPK13_gp66 [Bacillus phage Ray17]AYD80968.1 hypothetical protein Ray17_67 [Bacillus phage Ray17]